MKRRILIADADEKFSTELMTALQTCDMFEVVGLATDGEQAHIKGYQFLREAIILAVTDEDNSNAILKNRYQEVANAFETTARKVESAIRHAIEVAWDRGDLDTLQGYFGYTVSNTKGKPTNSEFISIVADRIGFGGRTIQMLWNDHSHLMRLLSAYG